MTAPEPTRIEDEIDRLYGLPLEAFTEARDALARRLRIQKRRAEALAVPRLAKPNRPAWTVNALYRARRVAFEVLLEAGTRARAAQALCFAGGPIEPLRAALADEQRALAGLLCEARRVLTGAGMVASRALLDRVAATLHALAVAPEGRAWLAGGRLLRDVDPPGFEVLTGLLAAPPPRSETMLCPDEPARPPPSPAARQVKVLKEGLSRAKAVPPGRAGSTGPAGRS